MLAHNLTYFGTNHKLSDSVGAGELTIGTYNIVVVYYTLNYIITNI